MSRDRKSKAETGIQALRHRLAAANPKFADASEEEAKRNELCACKFARNSDPLRGGFRVQS
jgi:hypothetical protein